MGVGLGLGVGVYGNWWHAWDEGSGLIDFNRVHTHTHNSGSYTSVKGDEEGQVSTEVKKCKPRILLTGSALPPGNCFDQLFYNHSYTWI